MSLHDLQQHRLSQFWNATSRGADFVAPERVEPAVTAQSRAPPGSGWSVSGAAGALGAENASLRDQVSRLNAELARYQAAGPPPGEAPSSGAGEPLAPWLTNSEFMSPLLTAYDRRLAELQGRLDGAEKTNSAIQQRLEEVLAENSRLHAQLNAQLAEAQRARGVAGSASGVGSMDSTVDAGPMPTTPEDWAVHQSRMRLLQEENDIAVRQIKEAEGKLQQALDDLDTRSRELLVAKQRASQVEETLTQAHTMLAADGSEAGQLKVQLNETTDVLNACQVELTRTRDELRAARATIDTHRKSLDEYRAAVTELTVQREALERELAAAKRSEADRDVALAAVQAELNDAKAVHTRAAADADAVVRERDELLRMMASVEARLAASDQKEVDAFKQVKESVDMVEDLKVARDQAVLREKAVAAQLAEAQNQLKSIRIDTEHQIRDAAADLRQLHAQEVAKLSDELRAMQLSTSDMHAQLERALRDKRAAEAALQRIQQDGPSDVASLKRTCDELTARVLAAEQGQDAAKLDAESAQNALRRAAEAWEKERVQLTSHTTQAQRRAKRMEAELEAVRGERQRLIEQLDAVHAERKTLLSSIEATKRTTASELTTMRRRADARVREAELKLQQSRDAQRQSASELEELVASQHALAAKWRDETATLTQRYEAMLREARAAAQRVSSRNDQLNARVAVLVQERQDAISDADAARSTTARVKLALEAAQRQQAELQRRLAEHAEEDVAVQREKKSLLRKVDELMLQLDRAKLAGGAIPR